MYGSTLGDAEIIELGDKGPSQAGLFDLILYSSYYVFLGGLVPIINALLDAL